MSNVLRDSLGRIIAHGSTTYMYNEEGIVSQEVFTEFSEKANKTFVYTWTFDGENLYVPHSIEQNGVHVRMEARKASSAEWWKENKTADKIKEVFKNDM